MIFGLLDGLVTASGHSAPETPGDGRFLGSPFLRSPVRPGASFWRRLYANVDSSAYKWVFGRWAHEAHRPNTVFFFARPAVVLLSVTRAFPLKPADVIDVDSSYNICSQICISNICILSVSKLRLEQGKRCSP